MSRLFDITTTNDTLTLEASGRGQIAFTVTNTASRPVRGRLRTKALDSGDPAWITVAGEAERDFSPNGTQQITVNVAVPAGTPPGKFRLRLDGVSVANPDEDFTEGPTIAVEVKPGGPPPPPPRWWIWVVVAVVLIVGGVIGYVVYAKSSGTVQVPKVVGTQFDEARDMLGKQGLKAFRKDQATPAKPAGQVLEQQPQAGEKVKKGTDVALTVAVAPAKPSTVEVPPVVGKALAAAKSQLEALGLRIAQVDQFIGDDCPGKVMRQSPAAGQQAQAASTVTLYVGKLQYGADQCRSGYVWRDAFVGDHVCVSVQRRTESAQENQLADSRRQPGGGAYGPETCRLGYVWREARPTDHVCVKPDRRTLVKEENARAANLRACNTQVATMHGLGPAIRIPGGVVIEKK